MNMNTKIVPGKFHSKTITYCSKDGNHLFSFQFVDRGNYFDIYCTYHPSFNGQDPNPRKTHIWNSGLICFVDGKEPRSWSEAEKYAAQWAEYFLEYRKTGITQS